MIGLNDFKKEPKALRDSSLEAVRKVLDSGWYVLGEKVSEFEAQWSITCGVAHACGVANGLDAIEIGLRALGVGPGDEVVTTSMSAFASTLAIIRAGATPVFADIDPSTALLDIESTKRCLSSKTKAVLLVHLYGQMKYMKQWQLFCKDHDLFLIEDAAQAHLSEDEGRCAGSYGEFAAYSFYPTKNLGAIGDAGAIVSESSDFIERCKVLRNYGQSERYHHPELGMNSRLDELQAAILIERLKSLSAFTERRQQIHRQYYTSIKNSLIGLLETPNTLDTQSCHLFVLLSDHRDELQAYLKQSSILSLAHYPIAIHKQKPCINYATDASGLSHTDSHADRCLSIPCHPQLTDEDISKIITTVNNFRI